MTLWLVRHARPTIAPGMCYGALDVPADKSATREAAQQLARVLPAHARLYTSTLQRCELLTEFLCGLRPDLTPDRDARLVEMNFGHFEGLAWADINKADFDAWTQDFANHRFGSAESVAEFMARVGAVWDECRHAAPTSNATVWITHAGVARAAQLLSVGIRIPATAAQWPSTAPDFGGWTTLPVVKRLVWSRH